MEHNKKTNLEVIDFALTEKGTPLKVKTTDNDGRPVWTWMANGDDRLVITEPGVYPYRGGVIEVSGEGPTITPLTITTLDFDEEVPDNTIWSPVKVDIQTEEAVLSTLSGSVQSTNNKIYSPVRVSIPQQAYALTSLDATISASNNTIYSPVSINIPTEAKVFTENVENVTPPNNKIWSPISVRIPVATVEWDDDEPGYVLKNRVNTDAFWGGATSGLLYTSDLTSTMSAFSTRHLGTYFSAVGLETNKIYTGKRWGYLTYPLVSSSSDTQNQIKAMADLVAMGSITEAFGVTLYSGYHYQYDNLSQVTYSGHTLWDWIFDVDKGTSMLVKAVEIANTQAADSIQSAHGYGIEGLQLISDNGFRAQTTNGNPYFSNWNDLKLLHFTFDYSGDLQRCDGNLFKNIPHLTTVYIGNLDYTRMDNASSFLTNCPDLQYVIVDAATQLAWLTTLPHLQSKITPEEKYMNWFVESSLGPHQWWDFDNWQWVTQTT